MKSLLKITTDYSLLKSMIKVEDAIKYCLNNNIGYCSICDNNLFGVINFYDKCKKNNIKPIIGLDVILNNSHIYLYAKNYEGYKNLLKINTIIQQRNIATIDLEFLQKDLIAVVPFTYKDIYEDINKIFRNTYISYQSESQKKESLLISKNVVFLNDIRALTEEDSKYLNYLDMINENATIKNYNMKDYSANIVLECNDDSVNKFIENINIEMEYEKNYIPKYNVDDSYKYLATLAHKGLLKRLNNKEDKIYLDRLEHELNVIKQTGFVDYFLIVYDYVLYAKKHNILVGAGRGSAAGCLVCYCLGITDIDPIKYNLLFERFLNKDRITMPDIDIDFENTKREQVIEYVKEKYNKDNVAGIMTYGTLKSKLVLRLTTKLLNIDSSLIDKFTSLIDSKLSLKDNLKNKKVLNYVNNNDEMKKAYKIAMKLENLKRNISQHAAGVVISSKKLDDIIPICISGEEIFTGVTMEYLENLGLLKMDFLAIKNLTTMANILEKIENDKNIKLNLNNIDLNDKKVLDLFKSGDTTGIFQFESEGMKNFLVKLGPSSFLDLVSAIALYRPGPMDNIDSFIRRKYKREKIDYIIPDLQSILKETYGIIVYQEQIMQILVRIAGYSFLEADNIRRAMSKKKKEVLQEEKEKFISRAKGNGYDEKLATKLYEYMLPFANYGFNKSHSVSYALIGYQMAYLKTYYKEYFYADLLNNSISSTEKTKEYIDDLRILNYKVNIVDINESDKDYIIKNNELYMPFGTIKNLGNISVNTILEERKKGKFKDFIDFVKRCYKNGINSKILESLINAGVFRNFNTNKKTLINNLDVVINYANLVSDLDEEYVEVPEIVETVDYTEDENRALEFETYGFYVGNHPSAKYTKGITKIKDCKFFYNRITKFAVLVENIKKIKTKNKEDMAFIDASDETGKITFVLFSNSYNQINNFKENQMVLIEGKTEKRLDKYQINITNSQIIK